jgi:hypothetical protein
MSPQYIADRFAGGGAVVAAIPLQGKIPVPAIGVGVAHESDPCARAGGENAEARAKSRIQARCGTERTKDEDRFTATSLGKHGSTAGGTRASGS